MEDTREPRRLTDDSRGVELLDVVAHHARRRERGPVRLERRADAGEPGAREAGLVAFVELARDLLVEQPVQLGAVALVLRRVVGILVARQRPAVRAVVALRPPAVEHAELQAA